jgi:CheY-like chemotaxis protein
MAKTILVVDDAASILMMMSKVLNMVGYNVITASDGKEGLSI